MEKRVLLAVFLSFLVLFVYQSLFVKPQPPGAPDAALESTARPAGEIEAVVEDRSDADPPEPAPHTTAAEVGVEATPIVAAREIRDVTVETERVRAVFTTQGGVLTSWTLKEFVGGDGEPLELVPSSLPTELARPFSLSVEDPDITRRLGAALFRPSVDALEIIDNSATLVFEYEDASGLKARKTFLFSPATAPYTTAFSAEVFDGGESLNPTIEWGTGMGGAAVGELSAYSQSAQGIFQREGKVSRVDVESLESEPAYDGVFRFIGADDHYFLSALLPDDSVRVEYRPWRATLPAGAEPNDSPPLVGYRVRFSDAPTDERFFFGPKEFDTLAKIDRELVRAIHFGWFSFLVVPLLRALKWIHGFVGNYGWSIIILTVLLNAAMFPLRHKSVVSMRKMQEIQPEMKAIQDRYAKLKTTDPARQKMNAELMNLYRERGVNPASGCMPMLLTMPVLFAFYSLLSVAIEIRDAPFVLWIQDLSQHDPMYVTPILMGITMFVQQRMTPSTADPTQQKIMTFMPLMFMFMFLWAPSGLVLYWLTSNVWAIGQQHVTNRLIGPPIVKTVRPPAERRVRKAGAGKTEQAKQRT